MTTLFVIGLITTLTFALSSLSVQHLQLSARAETRQRAVDLARSTASLAISRLCSDPDFGSAAHPGGLLRVPGEQPGEQGLASFEKSVAEQNGVPWSTNNLRSSEAVAGSEERTVPGAAARIVAVGVAGGIRRQVEVVLAVPTFPFALAAAGPVSALHGVTVAGLERVPDAPVHNLEGTVGADMLSNDVGQRAIFLGRDTRVQGAVQAAGQVQFDSAAPEGSIRISGPIRSHADPERIPRMALESYDPIRAGRTFLAISSRRLAEGSNVLGGSLRRQGSLEVTGGLHLDSCVLYVDGDLTVQGGISGKGVVVVTGDTTVEGQSEMVAGSGTALLSGGDLRLSGSGAEGSYFQGLVYTQGAFDADRVTLVGTLIAADEEARAPVTLSEMRLLHTPDPVVRVTTRTRSAAPASVVDTQSGNIEQNKGWWPDAYNLKVQSNSDGTFTVTLFQWHPVRFDFEPFVARSREEVMTEVQSRIGSRSAPGGKTEQIQQLLDRLRLPEGSTPDAEPTEGTGDAAVVVVDPSSFLKLQERIRVVLWREDRGAD